MAHVVRRAFLGLLCALLVSCGGGGGSSPTAPSAPTTATRIISIEGSLAFGDVQVAQTKELTITVRNSGNSTLTLGDVTGPASIAPMISATLPRTVAAGATGSMTFRFRPTTTGNLSGTITINADHTSGTNTVALTATGIAAPVTRISIAGVITDSATGAPVVGATVTGVNVLVNTNARSTTDGNGYYSLAGVAAGEFVNIDWTASGYVSQSAREIFTQDTRRDIRLVRSIVAPPTSAFRVGATCNDGTHSDATGSGACSSHMGVRCWLYSDGSCRAS
jgi:hypothetical protein